MKTLGWRMHICLLIMGAGGYIFQVFWVVYSTESRVILIRVCFCSDTEKELQSPDQSIDRERGKS